MASILLCGFTKQEIGACRLLTRSMPGVAVVEVLPAQLDDRLELVLTGKAVSAASDEPFDGRMAVFAGVQGKQLDMILGIPTRATSEKILKAVVTEQNRKWSLRKLYSELQREERAIASVSKKS